MNETMISKEDEVIVISNEREAASLMQTNALMPHSWQANIDFINHLTLFNDVLIAVLADKGAGKTTFIAQLLKDCDPNIKTFFHTAQSPFCYNDFLSQLVSDFHLRDESQQTLTEVAGQINERKQPVLVIIDNAENLSDEWLSAILMVIQQEKDGYLHFCLVSDFSLVASLNRLETRFSNLIHTIELGSLSEAELKLHVLSAYSEELILSSLPSSKWTELFELTEGKIAKINAHFPAWFDQVKTDSPVSISRSWKPRVLVAGFMMVVITAIFWQKQSSFITSSTVTELSFKVPPPRIPNAKEFRQEATAVSLPSQLDPISTSLFNVKHESSIPAWDVAATRQVLASTSLRQPILLAMNDDESDKLAPVTPRMITLKAVHVDSKRIQTNTPHDVVKNYHARNARSAHNLHRTQEKYTIQLVAGPNLAQLKRLQKHYAMTTSIRKLQRDGKLWYVLTYGQYSTRVNAVTALSKIISVDGLKPWIRPTSSF